MSKRLDKLLALVGKCEVLADVGCDHGYVGIEALRTGKARRVLFVDVSGLSLDKARANCPQEFADRARFVCRDGLGDLKADCAVIAGMGGLEIISILDRAQFPPPYLVLQPNRNPREVRDRLCEGYDITYDGMTSDGKIFYNMIVAERSDKPSDLSLLEREFGKTNLYCPTEDFRLYLNKERAKLTKILSGCSDPKVSDRLALVERALSAVGGQQ